GGPASTALVVEEGRVRRFRPGSRGRIDSGGGSRRDFQRPPARRDADSSSSLLTSLRPRQLLVLFFALAYAISWASFQILHGPSVFTLGPLLAALLLSAVTG